MQVQVRVDPKHIHHFVIDILDVNHNPTGETKDILQFDVQFPEYPTLPTYGLSIDFPISKAKAIAAITVKAQEALAQVAADEIIKNQLGSEILDFNVEV